MFFASAVVWILHDVHHTQYDSSLLLASVGRRSRIPVPSPLVAPMGDIPIQLGHYRLGKTLGIGSFGKVKRVLLVARRARSRASGRIRAGGGCGSAGVLGVACSSV